MRRRLRHSVTVVVALAWAVLLVVMALSYGHDHVGGGRPATMVGDQPVAGGSEANPAAAGTSSTTGPTVTTTVVAPSVAPATTTPRPVGASASAATQPSAPRPPVVPVGGLAVSPVTLQPVTAQPQRRSPADVAAPVLPGVVDVDSVIASQHTIAAGTGMVLTASGLVLTNNHVIDGASAISATEVSSGRTYDADVIGVDPTADIAILQLRGASGLPTVATATSSGLVPGQAVVAIGNAGGVGGAPAVTGGTVEATNQSIVARDAISGSDENLSGLVETDNVTVPGDSGGPLVDQSSAVIGMVTAGAVANGPSSVIDVTFAIPIDQALGVADQIKSGSASATVMLGRPGYLGAAVTSGPAGAHQGAVVTTVAVGSPAADAGLVAGDTIVSLAGVSVTSAQTLQSSLQPFRHGAVVTVAWLDQVGTRRSAQVTLAGGPAD